MHHRGEGAQDGGPPGYAYYGQTNEDFQANVFHSAPPEVVAAATAMRNRDPCGDVQPLTPASVANAANQGAIDAPVLLLLGEEDAIFQDGTAEAEADAFSRSDDVTLVEFPNSGRALTFEAAADDVRATVSDWLADRTSSGGAGPTDDGATSAPAPEAHNQRSGLPATGALELAPLGVALALLVVARRPTRQRAGDVSPAGPPR